MTVAASYGSGERTLEEAELRRLVVSVVMLGALGLVAAACGGGSSTTTQGNTSEGSTTSTSAAPTGAAQHDPRAVVNALNAAGLDMRVDRTQWVDSYTSVRLFPHHIGSPDAWTYGDMIVAAYGTSAHAAQRLHEDQVSDQFLAGWLCGSVTITIGQSTPRAVAQQEAQVVQHLPGCVRSFGTA